MQALLKVSVLALSIGYPFMVFWGLQHYDAQFLLPVLLTLLGLRWLSGAGSSERNVILATLLGVVGIMFFWGQQLGLKFYPVMMNAGFLVVFASSLLSPPTVIERFARLQEPDLPAEGVAYTRKVTWVWCGFFLLNGMIAASTAVWMTDEAWMLYNGLIAYLLIGALVVGEWLVRRWVRRA